MRRVLIAGNWKMHKTPRESVDFVKTLLSGLPKPLGIDVALCPPFTSLLSVAEALSGSPVALGAQDLHWEEEGAFTGEVSPKMLKAIGCRYVIIGHSERRIYFSETNAVIHQKLRGAIRHGLSPILCVGERLEEREKNRTFEVVANHLSVFHEIAEREAKNIAIAYEPVWAIGTGKTATPSQAQEVHAWVRHRLRETYGEDFSESLRILYGGSVKPENIEELVREPDIDGALVGGASLDVKSFLRIVEGGLLKMKVRVQ